MDYKNKFTVLMLVMALVAVFEYIRMPRTSVKYCDETDTITGTETTRLPMDANIDPSWRETELAKLSNLIQRRLDYIQNPKSCQDAKKVVCTFNSAGKTGYGTQMQDWVACFIVAYATQRTFILNSTGWPYLMRGLETYFLPLSTNCTSTENQTVTKKSDLNNIDEFPVVKLPRNVGIRNRPNYLPNAIPEDIADDILRLHTDPYTWWIGQFLVYLTRPNDHFKKLTKDNLSALKFRHPIVGVHVRRTDKIHIAGSYQLEEYMTHVEAWFDKYEKDHIVDHRRVYLVSDDDAVLTEARLRYPTYIFLFNETATLLAKNKKETRFSESSLRGFVLDIHALSMCDFVVCTLTSNVARYVYLLMTARFWDSLDRIHSLDTGYSFSARKRHVDFKNEGGDSFKFGLTPSHGMNITKVVFSPDNDDSIVNMPTYVEVPRV